VELVYSDLSVPWSIEFATASNAYVTERNGKVLSIDLASRTQTELPVPSNIYASGQGGLLDLALSPLHHDRLYLTYSQDRDQGAVTALAMLDLTQQSSGWKTLFTANMDGSGGRHFGSRLLINDNYIYMTIGERGERDAAQQLENHNGTIVRLMHDGSSANNPTIGGNALPEIYSYGHRNPQGITMDDKGQLWSIEHGPRGGDEINLIQEGGNYGWPVVSHGKEYWGPLSVGDGTSAPGMVDPKLVYIPSIAPGSLLYYSGARYPSLNGKLLAGALKLTHINVINMQSDPLVEERRLFESLSERIRDIAVSPDDFIYFTTDRGNIYKVLPEVQ
jgi:glucose/arabinose dehydrogenase